jgi:hypothetical protein
VPLSDKSDKDKDDESGNTEKDEGADTEKKQGLEERSAWAPLLAGDERAKPYYKTEKVKLKAQLSAAKAKGDKNEVERITEILAFVVPDRDISDEEAERERKRIWAAVDTAKDKINEHLPELYGHLDEFLKIGKTCLYNPPLGTSWIT